MKASDMALGSCLNFLCAFSAVLRVSAVIMFLRLFYRRVAEIAE
jgi:hypothetical protein